MAKHVVRELPTGVFAIIRIDPVSGKKKEVGRSRTREKAQESARIRERAAERKYTHA